MVKKILDGSHSLWMDEKLPAFPPLKKDMQADVCIVGAGIVGLTNAYFLAKEGLSVVVLESNTIGGRESLRTTGHLSWILGDHFYELKNTFGFDNAVLAGQSHHEAIQIIQNIIENEKISCDFEKVNAFLFPGQKKDSVNIKEEEHILKKMGLPFKKHAKPPLKTFDGPCIEYLDNAQFHVAKYLNGLIERLVSMGVKIYSQSHVSEIEEGCVKTSHSKVFTHSIIVATNTPINDRFMMHTKQASYRTFVIGALIPEGSIPKGLYYDTLDPYHYVRLQPSDQKSMEWIILGGEDQKTGQENKNIDPYFVLENWGRQHFPMMQEVSYKWSGQIIESIDGLGYIGRNPHDKNIYIATGDSGDGLTNGTIAGVLITGLITKNEHPWEKLYSPSRKNLHAAGEYLKENLNTALQYKDWLLPCEIKSIEQIPKESGAIIGSGMKKLAIYRDNKDQLHTLSAVCPHLGGIVRWNPEEKSWDCPCHGSRFNIEGEVLNGPSLNPLKSCPEKK